MLPITRATVDKFCCSCLLELPQNNTKKIENDDIELHEWLQATTSSSLFVLKEQSDQSKNYTKSLCNPCYTKARLFYGFRVKALCASVAYKEVIAEKRVNSNNLRKLRWFCITCLKNLLSSDGELIGYDLLEDERLQDWLMKCCEVDINDVNFAPTRLCHQCFRKLRSFSEFKRVSLEAQEYLDSVLGNNEENNIGELTYVINEITPKAEVVYEDDLLYDDTISPLDDEEFVLTSNIKIEEEVIHDPLNVNTKNPCILSVNAKDIEESGNDYDNNLFDGTENTNNNSDENINDNVTEVVTGDRILRSRKLRKHSPTENASDSNDEDEEDDDYDWEDTSIPIPPSKKRYELSNESTTDSTPSSSKTQDKKRIPCKTIKCEQCGKNFRKLFMYEAHVRGQHEGVEKPFFCEKCPKTFSRYSLIRRHYIKVHNIMYRLKDSTTKMDTLLENSLWKCPKCNLVLLTKGELSGHVARTHDNVRLYKCDYCSRNFKRKHHLTDHIKAVHQCIRAFKCSFCDKTFAARRTMRVHEMGHRGERPFSCEHCDKTFRQSSDLKIHVEKHTTDPSLLCPICYRAKSTIEELQEHIAQHKANSYQCTKCGKTFKKLSHLKEHDDAVHLLLRPFKCDFCDLSFSARKTRSVHRLIHTEEWPEVCSICQKRFRATTNLQKHMRTHKSKAAKETTTTEIKDDNLEVVTIKEEIAPEFDQYE